MVENDLLHDGEPEALRDAAFQLAQQLDGVEHATDVLGRCDLDDPHEAEIQVDVHHCAVSGEGERDEGVSLPVRVQFLGGGVVELDGLFQHLARGGLGNRESHLSVERDDPPVDDVEGLAGDGVPARDRGEQALANCEAGRLNGSARHPGLAARRSRPRRADVGRAGGREHDVDDSEHVTGDLLGKGDEALPNLDGRTGDGGDTVFQAAPCRRVVVEATAVHEVLYAHGKADTTAHATAFGRSAGAAGELQVRCGHGTTRGKRRSGAGADHLGDRRGTPQHLPGRKRVAGLEHIAQPQLDRVDAERCGELVHLGLVCETDLHRAETPHRPARGVVGADRYRLDDGVGDPVGPGRHAGGVHGHGRRRRQICAAVEDDPRLDLDEQAVGIGVMAVPHDRRMPVHVTEEGLLAGVDHLHRTTGVQRQQAYLHVHREVLAGPEGTTDPGQVKPDLLERESQACRHLLLVHVQPLSGDVEVDSAVV